MRVLNEGSVEGSERGLEKGFCKGCFFFFFLGGGGPGFRVCGLEAFEFRIWEFDVVGLWGLGVVV